VQRDLVELDARARRRSSRACVKCRPAVAPPPTPVAARTPSDSAPDHPPSASRTVRCRAAAAGARVPPSAPRSSVEALDESRTVGSAPTMRNRSPPTESSAPTRQRRPGRTRARQRRSSSRAKKSSSTGRPPESRARTRAGMTRELLTTMQSPGRNRSGSSANARSSSAPGRDRSRGAARRRGRLRAPARSRRAAARSRTWSTPRPVSVHGRRPASPPLRARARHRGSADVTLTAPRAFPEGRAALQD